MCTWTSGITLAPGAISDVKGRRVAGQGPGARRARAGPRYTISKMIEPGSKAPDFELPDQDGRTVKLSDFKGTPVVVYFYPKADTPGD